MNGIINIYKEKGFTSFDVVAKLRRIFNIKRIGHTGTLDPDAEGVLPVCIGNAVKLCEILTEKDKAYEAVIKLGLITDTQDISGRVLDEKELFVNRMNFIRAVKSFTGSGSQVPPMYSAVKVNGRKLYEYAREGKEIERPLRPVVIHSIEVSGINEENGCVSEAVLKIECSKGTYVRTLCHDIGIKLSQGACMKELLRTRSGRFLIKDSIKLHEIERMVKDGTIEDAVMPAEHVLDYKSLIVDERYNKYLMNGNKLKQEHIILDGENRNNINDSELFKVYDHLNNFIAIYKYDDGRMIYHPYKMFL